MEISATFFRFPLMYGLIQFYMFSYALLQFINFSHSEKTYKIVENRIGINTAKCPNWNGFLQFCTVLYGFLRFLTISYVYLSFFHTGSYTYFEIKKRYINMNIILVKYLENRYYNVLIEGKMYLWRWSTCGVLLPDNGE